MPGSTPSTTPPSDPRPTDVRGRRPIPNRKGRAQSLEVATGGLGALTFFLLITTVWAEVTGRPAGFLALLLLLFVLATVYVFRAWRRVLSG